jgi:hypothetical protein
VAVAAVGATAVTAKRARTPPSYTVTVVLRVTEGQMGARGELGAGALRTHLKELTFTRARIADLIRSHPAEFPGAAKDLDGAYEDVRERIKVEITQNDFIDDRRESDSPRSARITLSYSASKPKVAWDITHALADLAIDSALARQRAALLREQVGAESAVERAQLNTDDTTAADIRSLVGRLKETEARAASARLGLRAAEEQQGLRFELVDPGRMPSPVTKAALASDAIVTFAIALLAACVLAGAFDPRVVDAGDLSVVGVPLLGRLPPLPGPPDRVRQTQQNVSDTAPPPSDDLGPRV